MVSAASHRHDHISSSAYSQLSNNESVKPITAAFFENIKPQSSKAARLIQAVVLTALLAAAAALVICFAASPVGLIGTALSISAIAAKAILGVSIAATLTGLFLLTSGLTNKKTRQMIAFELTAQIRLWKEKNHDQIPLDGLDFDDVTNDKAREAALFLGALPNQHKFKQGLKDLEKNGAVFSVNEEFELAPIGPSLPFRWQTWASRNIACSGMIAPDHELLSAEQMDFAADQIQEWVKQGKKIYVHCRGGVGRSSTVIAAFLMKYGRKNGQKLTLEEICSLIKKYRPKATIFNKIPALLDYDRSLRHERGESSAAFNNLLEHFAQHPNSKAPKHLVQVIVNAQELVQ